MKNFSNKDRMNYAFKSFMVMTKAKTYKRRHFCKQITCKKKKVFNLHSFKMKNEKIVHLPLRFLFATYKD